jgi:hypothetical protein
VDDEALWPFLTSIALDPMPTLSMSSTDTATVDFHFVNKDPRSTSLSNGGHDDAASWIVHRHAQIWRPQGPRRLLQSTPRPTTGLVGWQVHPAAGERQARRPHASYKGSRRSIRSKQRLTFEENETYKAREQGDGSHVTTSPQKSIGNAIDPFRCSAAPIDRWEYSLLQYCEGTYLPIRFRACQLRGYNPSRHVLLESRDIIQDCFVTDFHMYAMFAAATARMKYIHLERLPRNDIPECYAIKAIQLLRKYLASNQPVTSQVLRGMLFLVHIETGVGNLQGARTYLELAKRLVNLGGGFRKFDAEIFESWTHGDFSVANEMELPPVFERDRDPGPFIGPLPMSSSGSALLGALDLFDWPLQLLSKDLISYDHVVGHFRSVTNEPIFSNFWIFERRSALIHRLLSIPLKSRMVLLQRDLLQECCRLAFLIWVIHCSLSVPWLPKHLGAYKMILPDNVSKLRLSLIRLHQVPWDYPSTFGKDLALWIAALGVLVGNDLENRDYFKLKFVQNAADMGIHSKQHLSTVLDRHLSLDGIATDYLSILFVLLTHREDGEECKTSFGPSAIDAQMSA